MYKSQTHKVRIHVDSLWKVLEDIEQGYDICVWEGKYQGLGTMNHDAKYLQKELTRLLLHVDKVVGVF